MNDALCLLYYSWLSINDKGLYKDEKNDFLIKSEVNDKAKASINAILDKMSKKGLTKKGKARKVSIYEKLILKKEKPQLTASFYNSILPIFKCFVLIFEQKSPQVHRIQSEISELIRDFFSCFTKHESLKGLTGSKLEKLNIKNESRKTKDFYTGSSAEKIARKLCKGKKDDIVTEFQSSVKKSFIRPSTCNKNPL